MIRNPLLHAEQFDLCPCPQCQRQRLGLAKLMQEMQAATPPQDEAPPLVHGAGVVTAAVCLLALVCVVGSVYGFILLCGRVL